MIDILHFLFLFFNRFSNLNIFIYITGTVINKYKSGQMFVVTELLKVHFDGASGCGRVYKW